MYYEEETPIKSVKYSPGDDLSKFSVDELKHLLVKIDAEKSRIENEIKSKSSLKQSAEDFFKK